jgi:transposase
LLGRLYTVDGKQLQQQYKDYLSNYHAWEQKDHADEWMLFEDNIGPSLSIDETALSNGELYTIVTNKAAKGGKKAIVAMLKGTQAEQIITVLERIPLRRRKKFKEVTMEFHTFQILLFKALVFFP